MSPGFNRAAFSEPQRIPSSSAVGDDQAGSSSAVQVGENLIGFAAEGFYHFFPIYLHEGGAVRQAVFQVLPPIVQNDRASAFPRPFYHPGIESGGKSRGLAAADDQQVRPGQFGQEQGADSLFSLPIHWISGLHQFSCQAPAAVDGGGAEADISPAGRRNDFDAVGGAEPAEKLREASADLGEVADFESELVQDPGGVHPLARGIQPQQVGPVHFPGRQGIEYQGLLQRRIEADRQRGAIFHQPHILRMCRSNRLAFTSREIISSWRSRRERYSSPRSAAIL
jgi:hypothetical protein